LIGPLDCAWLGEAVASASNAPAARTVSRGATRQSCVFIERPPSSMIRRRWLRFSARIMLEQLLKAQWVI
jgi:hypothetical protein